MFDKDGYPTEECLKDIEDFEVIGEEKVKAFLNLIQDVWSYPDRFVLRGKRVLRLYLSTGGWSGNESVIYAMKQNFFWRAYWQKSTRGGHYWFRIPPLKQKPNRHK